jgi:hypothetical protein
VGNLHDDPKCLVGEIRQQPRRGGKGCVCAGAFGMFDTSDEASECGDLDKSVRHRARGPKDDCLRRRRRVVSGSACPSEKVAAMWRAEVDGGPSDARARSECGRLAYDERSGGAGARREASDRVEERGAAVESVGGCLFKPLDQPRDDAIDPKSGVPLAIDVQVDAEDVAEEDVRIADEPVMLDEDARWQVGVEVAEPELDVLVVS